MILAISRFRIGNGTQAAVAAAFAQRVGLVDSQPGFLGMEVFTDAGDDATFNLVTRWSDQASFETWHRSDAHRESHRAMPRGIKLDKAQTRLYVMNRIPSGTRAGGPDSAVGDAALLEDMTRINNELVEISRESARRGEALARALAALEEKNAALERAHEHIVELSRTDSMTGLLNRRHFDETFSVEVDRARRQGTGLCAMMVDLDHFKSVNDRYGHGMGDRVLIAAAAALKAQSRPYDVVARYGGEEFIVLLPDTTLDGARACAERMRSAIAALAVEGYPHPITASLGVAALAEGEARHQLQSRTDAALYRAKDGGRNRVATDPASDPDRL